MKDYFKQKSFLASINRGDHQSFLQAHCFYAPKLFRHVFYRLNSKEIAEDTTSQVFLKTWEYLTQGKKIKDLNAFLYKMANNLVIDYWRRAERKNSPIEEVSERNLSVEPSYNQEIDFRLAVSDVRRLVDRLDEEKRELVVWRYLDGLTIRQIAEISGKSANTVYVSLHRAVKELKKISEKKYENK